MSGPDSVQGAGASCRHGPDSMRRQGLGLARTKGAGQTLRLVRKRGEQVFRTDKLKKSFDFQSNLYYDLYDLYFLF